MKTLALRVALVVGCLLILTPVSTFAQSGARRAARAHAQTTTPRSFAVNFTGYCAWLNITMQGNNLNYGEDEEDCGSSSTPITGIGAGFQAGTAPFASAAGGGLDISDPVGAPNAPESSIFWLLNFTTKTWAVYAGSGSSVFESGSGTFTTSAAHTSADAVNAGGRSTVSRIAPVATVGQSFAVNFTGFCDWLNITTQANSLNYGVHENVNVNGGCTGGASTPIVGIGAGFQAGTAPFASAAGGGLDISDVAFAPDGFSAFFLLNFTTKTWAVYTSDGSSVVENNSGTFTIGAVHTSPNGANTGSSTAIQR